MTVTRLVVIQWIFLPYICLCICRRSRRDSIGTMPVDAKVRAILDAAKALGSKPLELQTPEEARAARAEMMRRFVPMPEYAGVQVEQRAIVANDTAGGREIALRVYRPAGSRG